MSAIAARYRGDADGPDKVPPAPVARSTAAASDSLDLAAAGTLGGGVRGVAGEFGGPRPSRPQQREEVGGGGGGG